MGGRVVATFDQELLYDSNNIEASFVVGIETYSWREARYVGLLYDDSNIQSSFVESTTICTTLLQPNYNNREYLCRKLTHKEIDDNFKFFKNRGMTELGETGDTDTPVSVIRHTLTEDIVIAPLLNVGAGSHGLILLDQDGTGSHECTFEYPTYIETGYWSGLSKEANHISVIHFESIDGVTFLIELLYTGISPHLLVYGEDSNVDQTITHNSSNIGSIFFTEPGEQEQYSDVFDQRIHHYNSNIAPIFFTEIEGYPDVFDQRVHHYSGNIAPIFYEE